MKNRSAQFKLLRIRRPTRYVAARQAVLSPILGKWGDDSRDNGIPDAMEKLRGLWYKRLVELRQAGWSRIKDNLSRLYAQNCPPFGVVTNTQSRCCNVAHICPFCYGRQVVLFPFIDFEFALYGDLKPGLVNRYQRAVLLDFTTRRSIRTNKNTISTPAAIGVMTEAAKLLIKRDRTREIEAFRPLGGIVLHRVFPQENAWHFVRSGVLLCDARKLKSQSYTTDTGETHELHTSEITRTDLCAAFSRSFRYPASLLTSPAENTLPVLNALAGARLLSRYGLLRGGSRQQSEDVGD
jgi:hypothetical protein